MKTCNYPHCKETELNEWGMCEGHRPSYSQHRDIRAIETGFSMKYLHDGFKRLAKNARDRKYVIKNTTKLVDDQLTMDIKDVLL